MKNLKPFPKLGFSSPINTQRQTPVTCLTVFCTVPSFGWFLQLSWSFPSICPWLMSPYAWLLRADCLLAIDWVCVLIKAVRLTGSTPWCHWWRLSVAVNQLVRKSIDAGPGWYLDDDCRQTEPSKYQLSLAIPLCVGAMSNSESWDVNGRTARCTSPVSVV